jgi:putative transposase
VAKDEHGLRVLRYVERNPLRAGLTRSARRWRWSSLGRVTLGLPRSVARGVPFGAESWQRQTAKRLGQESSLRPVGRPSKAEKVPEKQ